MPVPMKGGQVRWKGKADREGEGGASSGAVAAGVVEAWGLGLAEGGGGVAVAEVPDGLVDEEVGVR